MSTIQQLCPSCNRLLELPASATGRLAKCPACEATFTIGVKEATKTADAQPPVEVRADSSQPDPTPPIDTPQPDTSSNNPASAVDSVSTAEPASQGVNPFSAPLKSMPPAQTQVNPYEPVSHPDPDPVAIVGELQIAPRSIEEILSPTLSIFGARLGYLILAFALWLIASLVVFGVPLAILTALADAGKSLFVGIGILLGVPLMSFFASYLSVGLARNAIAVARNAPSPMKEWLPPLSVVFRFLAGGVAMALVVIVFGALFSAFLMAIATVGGNEGIAAFFGALGVFVSILASMAAFWLLWAWLLIVSDGKGTAIGSMQAAFTLTMHNKLTSLMLIVMATVLSAAGASACYIGLLITQPLINLMFAVGYLLMTNQKIDNPRVTRQTNHSPPPTEPTF